MASRFAVFDTLRVAASRLRGLFTHRRLDEDFQQELDSHLALLTEENIRCGMSPEEARRAAHVRLGGVTQLRDTNRELHGLPRLEALIQDVRYAFRMLRKNPRFTAVAVLTLALGIGANTAIFSLIDAFLLRELPVKDPQQLVIVNRVTPKGGLDDDFPYATFEQFRDLNHSFSGIFAWDGSTMSVTVNGQPEFVSGDFVSGSYFDVLGVHALVGRPFADDDDKPGRPPVAVISFSYWKRRFSQDTAVTGKSIYLAGTPFTVIGVMPPTFYGRNVAGRSADVMLPMFVHPWLGLKDHNTFEIMARLKPGVTTAQAQADLDVIYRQALTQAAGSHLSPQADQDIHAQKIELKPGSRGVGEPSDHFAVEMRILMCVVAVVLLIASVNVAGLLLARAAGRQKEIAVRLAIGASRARVSAQLVCESTLLAATGGALGFLFAKWGVSSLVAILSMGADPFSFDLRPDPRMLAFTAAVSLLTGVLLGLVPAFAASRVDLNPILKGAEGSSESRPSRYSLGKSLVASQVALSLALLIGAGLLIRTLRQVYTIDTGFDRDHVLFAWILPALNGYDHAKEMNLYRELLERMNSIPGIQSATLARYRQFVARPEQDVWVQGSDAGSRGIYARTFTGRAVPAVYYNPVGPGFFGIMGIGQLLGRDFALTDTETSPKVAIMLRTLPVRDPGRLVQLLHQYPGEPRMTGFSWQTYQDFRDQNHVFSGLIGAALVSFTVRGANLAPETIDGHYVAGDFFSVLGVEPAVGRLIVPEDDRIGDPTPIVVLSWSFWKNRFDSDPHILGKEIIVDDVPLTVVGVTPPVFFGLQVGVRPEIYVSLAAEALIDHPSRLASDIGLAVMARLKPGVSIKQARADMSVLGQRWVEQISKNSKDPLRHQMRFEVEPAAGGFSFVRDQVGQPLWVLMALVSLLLLIASTNVASLLLARGAAREREMAVRVALGCGRSRLVRQVLTESLLLSAVGSLLGILFASFGARALVRIMTSGRLLPGFPAHLEDQVHLDLPVLALTAAVALLVGLLFGLASAMRALRTAPIGSLRQAGAAGHTRFQRFFGTGLVITQLAVSVVMVSTGGLFVGYLEHLEHQNLGFRKDHLLLITLDPANSGYKPEDLCRLHQGLLTRLEAIPGVRSATLSGMTPLSGAAAPLFINVEGHPEGSEDRRYVMGNWVGAKYFATYATPLLAGRDFTPRDLTGPRVAIINRAMARYYVGERNPIGMHFSITGPQWLLNHSDDPNATEPYEVVGEVADAKYNDIREAAPRTIYFVAQAPSAFTIRTSINPEAVVPDVRGTVRELLKTVPVTNIRTMAEQVDASIVPERLMAVLSGWLGALGALLATVGLYGLLAYTVARRTNEIGIRMALGATAGDVSRTVLGDALRMVFIGLLIGVPIALWSKHLAVHLLEGLAAESSLPVMVGTVGMVAVALVASYIPARRATRVDPMVALRYE